MATLALSAVGASIGSALLPGGVTILGASIAGATIGSQIGALAGSQIDQALFRSAGSARGVDGPRLSDLRVTSSSEGVAIPRLYGRARLGSQIIWATALEEVAVARDQPSGAGKGVGGGNRSTGSDFAYYANVAVALCEGEITAVSRCWADGREIDLSGYTWRIYRGTQTQLADPLILQKQGAGQAPAYRGLAYIVFERLPLDAFGNRIPQLSFEVSRAVDTLERDIKGVCLIPGSGEFVYEPSPIDHTVGPLTTIAENRHTRLGGTDFEVAVDQLQSNLPNARSVSLLVSWFGDDLRADHCQLRPLVERASKDTSPSTWSVAGIARESAQVVSSHGGHPAYGGTPSDASVVAAIANLKARGLSVVFSPFILMDIAQANTRTDPYSGNNAQPAYPWRGRITVSPAAGAAGSPDKTAAAATAIAAFVGTATAANFAITAGTVQYSGPDEWSFRRFILHYAHLCKAAGGVDAFVLCSELRGLTTVRSGPNAYPFVSALSALATEVRAILGPATKLIYAADWSEYFGHQPSDGSGDVHFHLDPLWASPAIDAIGIDVYWPLADWRDGGDHADAVAGIPSASDLDYLKRRLFSGEGYDWHYATDADRDAQVRTPITDGAADPWAFRYKDLKSWWSQQHFDRTAGVVAASPTAWAPQSKPFWFMEIGCPAIDKGANQPNVFVDRKSSESLVPHYSTSARDDFIQRRLLQAFVEAFDPAHPGYVAGANPVSASTGQRMIDCARMHVYCWDARPYPAFPQQASLWRDAENWATGHWINGRLAAAPLPALVAKLLGDYEFAAFDTSRLSGSIGGLVLDRVMSAREALQPVELSMSIDAVESEGLIHFRRRGADSAVAALAVADVVERAPQAPLLQLTRAQETDLPASVKIGFISTDGDYPQAVAEARRAVGAAGRVSTASLGLVLDPTNADAIAETWLFESWASRERASFSLPPSLMRFEPGDIVTIETASRRHDLRIVDVGDHGARDIEARSIDPALYGARPIAPREVPPARNVPSGAPTVYFLDIPPASTDPAEAGVIAAAQVPWPGPVAAFRAPDTAGFVLDTILPTPATVGHTASDLPEAPHSRFDHATRLIVTLDRGELAAVTDLALFAGANTAAVEVEPGRWEVLQFKSAELVAPAQYALTGLLRGQRGTNGAAQSTVAAGARFVLLDASARPTGTTAADIGLPLTWKVGPANRDIGAPSYASFVQPFTGQGLKPLSPVHVRASRATNGDLTISWTRRSRIDGDSWELHEVPLGESTERYIVDIVDETAIKRSIVATTAQITYAAADQMADFGTLPLSIAVRIAQLSETVGRGTSLTATL